MDYFTYYEEGGTSLVTITIIAKTLIATISYNFTKVIAWNYIVAIIIIEVTTKEAIVIIKTLITIIAAFYFNLITVISFGDKSNVQDAQALKINNLDHFRIILWHFFLFQDHLNLHNGIPLL